MVIETVQQIPFSHIAGQRTADYGITYFCFRYCNRMSTVSVISKYSGFGNGQSVWSKQPTQRSLIHFRIRNLTIASHSKGYANISVTLKDGWEYDIADEAETNEFAINIYPAGQSQNKIRIAYFNGFGVCGTGLEQETIMLGRYEAWMGTYDNNTVWDFISLQGLPGDYAILNEGGEKWWSEYGEDAMQILATLKVADGWCVGDQVLCTYENTYYDEVNQRVEVDFLTVEPSDWAPDPNAVYKPVIYLYPTEKTEVTVKLDYSGHLTCTYPAYNDGWTVTASPDGILTDANGQTYNYLYWEGETYTQYDMTKGFCVKGEDTAAFLEDALAKLGLNRREANEFIVFWLPLMQENPYNIISFQTDVYTESAKLTVTPTPDTVIRVFMAYKSADNYVEIEAQELTAPAREGFTVIEWGGKEVK